MFWFDSDFYSTWDGRPDRSSWAEKSDAALRREREARTIFHNQFLPQAKKATSFPFTMEGLVHPTVHLTDPCWRDFKKEVVRHGCTTKRRVVTPQEKSALQKSKVRRGKMYWIDVTISAHPDQALKVLKEKKDKAAEAKRKKDAKAKKQAEERRLKMEEERRKEKAIKDLVDKEYDEVVKAVRGDLGPIKDISKKRSLEETTTSAGPEQAKDACAVPSPTKKRKDNSINDIKITAPIPRLLSQANLKHSEKVIQIRDQISKEKNIEEKRVLDEVRQKMKAEEEKRIKEAEEYRDVIKKVIQGFGSSSSVTRSTGKSAPVVTKVDVASIPQ